MKPIFCTDLTVDKNNQTINGEEFVSSVVDPKKREKLDQLAEDLEAAMEKTNVPSWMVLVRSISGWMALFMGLGIMRAVSDSGINSIFSSNTISSTLLCLLAAGAWFYLTKRTRDMQKNAANSPEIKEKSNALECEMIMLQNSMGVPTNAKHADVIVFPYTVVDGKITPSKKKLLPPSIFLIDVMAYEDGDRISICDTEKIYTFEKADIKRIRKVEEQISVHLWNKDEEPTSARYAKYGMRLTTNGMVSMNYYYAIEISAFGQDYELYFPCYELPVFAGFLAPEMLAGIDEDEDDFDDEIEDDFDNDAQSDYIDEANEEMSPTLKAGESDAENTEESAEEITEESADEAPETEEDAEDIADDFFDDHDDKTEE